MNALLYISASLAILLAAYLATGTTLPQTPRRLLAAALLTLALLNLLAILQIDNPNAPLVMLRPMLAMVFPALLFLHVASATREEPKLYRFDTIHVIGPVLGTAIWFSPMRGQIIDLYIILIHVLYLLLIAWVSRHKANSFVALGPQLSVLFDRWRRVVIGFLMISILADSFITLEIGGNAAALAYSWVIVLSSILLVCGLSYLLITSLHRTGPLIWAGMRFRPHSKEQRELIEWLEEVLVSTGAFLNPNLTLLRFARKSGVPTRDVSAAINEHRQCNYNQWLNGFRVEEAQRLIRSDPKQSMTEIMFAAGFQNKSTFNAAFRSLVGESPSSWRNGTFSNSTLDNPPIRD
jgi:AraC-like DNA-binding protein